MAWPKILEERLAAIEAKQDEILAALRGDTKATKTAANVPADAVGPVTVETVETVEPTKDKATKTDEPKATAKKDKGATASRVNWNS